MKSKGVAPYLGQSWVQSLLDSVCPKVVRQKVVRVHSWLVKLQKTPSLADEVDENPFLLQSTADTQSTPAQKKKTVSEAPVVQEALATVNKQLASELAISQISVCNMGLN